jgi:anaerobic selenocysteine-containing dehydrogenase
MSASSKGNAKGNGLSGDRGEKGFRRISWDEALGVAARGLRETARNAVAAVPA